MSSQLRVFISYAWESDEYREFVKRLAARLRTDGINARLDAWHLDDGSTIPEFMDREVRHADKILILCSPEYRRKVNAMADGEQITGSGWEYSLVTSSIWAGIDQRSKVKVALLRGVWREAIPQFLIGLPHVDLSNIDHFETKYRELLQSLTGQREQAPPLGQLPASAPKPVQPLRGPDSNETSHEAPADNEEHTPVAGQVKKSDANLEAALGLYFAEAGLDSLSRMPMLACAVIENPESVRKAVEDTRRRLMNSTVLDLSSEVRERLRKVGFDYPLDDSGVRSKFIETIATLTYQAYTCTAERAYFKNASEEGIFFELFGRLLFDRISKHKAERIEIFLMDERAGTLEALEGILSSCVHRINLRGRGQVRYRPLIHMMKPRDGCIELARYVSAIVGRRLDQGESALLDRRDYKRIESKVRLIHRLDTGQRFSRHHPLPD